MSFIHSSFLSFHIVWHCFSIKELAMLSLSIYSALRFLLVSSLVVVVVIVVVVAVVVVPAVIVAADLCC